MLKGKKRVWAKRPTKTSSKPKKSAETLKKERNDRYVGSPTCDRCGQRDWVTTGGKPEKYCHYCDNWHTEVHKPKETEDVVG